MLTGKKRQSREGKLGVREAPVRKWSANEERAGRREWSII